MGTKFKIINDRLLVHHKTEWTWYFIREIKKIKLVGEDSRWLPTHINIDGDSYQESSGENFKDKYDQLIKDIEAFLTNHETTSIIDNYEGINGDK